MSKISKLKILHVIHWPKSGIVSLVRNMLPLFDNTKYENYVIFFEKDNETINNFRNVCSSVTCLSFSDNKIRGLNKYNSFVSTISPHILHTHSFQPGTWGRLFRPYKQLKYICTLHNSYPYFSSKHPKDIIKRILEAFLIRITRTVVVCVSSAVAKAAKNFLSNYPMVIIENGIKLDPFYYDLFNRRMMKFSNEIIIISIGRLDHQKGFDVLLDAYSRVVKYFKNTKLIIIGDGVEKKKLKKIAERLNIQEKVFFTGYQTNLQKYLEEADIYVCSSQYEGLPLSVAEAMLSGLPVIASNVGGH